MPNAAGTSLRCEYLSNNTRQKLTQHDVTGVAGIWLASIALPNAAGASLRSCTAY